MEQLDIFSVRLKPQSRPANIQPATFEPTIEMTHYAPTSELAREWVEAMKGQEAVRAFRILQVKSQPRWRKGKRWGSAWWMGQIYLSEDATLKPESFKRKIVKLDDHTAIRWRIAPPGFYSTLAAHYVT